MPSNPLLAAAAERGPRIVRSRRRLAGVAVAALVLAPAARAHVTLSPAFVEAGVPSTVAFATPNERKGHATTSLRIEAPPGVELRAERPPPGWSLSVSDRFATWTGGRIENTDVVSFALGVTARTRAGTETFRAVQGYDDDEVVRWDAPLTVVPASADAAPSEQPRRAILAGAVGLLVIGVSLFFLWRARRGPLQER
jgi:uncharacterized protein YcnI